MRCRRACAATVPSAATPSEWRLSVFLGEVPIEPAIRRAFNSGRADFHIVLGIEMGARVVG